MKSAMHPLILKNKKAAQRFGISDSRSLQLLAQWSVAFEFSIDAGDLILLDHHWYVTHTGLIALAARRACHAIDVSVDSALSDPSMHRWVFRAVAYPKAESHGFVGYGDADPSNVSSLVRGAELRVAETRAVNRALRKAYGIGLCSAEELGSPSGSSEPGQKGRSAMPTNGNGKLRDRLADLIRHHGLDPQQVRAYAVDYCGTANLRDASREQLESFFEHLAEWAGSDRASLACKLTSYAKAGVPA
jgi:hypothetical protein